MAITPASWSTYTGGANFVGTTSPTSTSVSPPTGLASGDTWIVVAVDWNGSGGSWNTPAGWTKQSASWNDGASGNVGVTLWYKPNCTGGETATTFTNTVAAGNCLYAIGSWRQSGVPTGTPWVDISDGSKSVEYSASVATSAIGTAASHTPTAANEIVYLIYAQGSGGETNVGGITWGTPSGFTSLGVANHDTAAAGGTGVGDPASCAVFYAVQTTATAVPITSSTATFPGNSKNAGGEVGVIISFYAAGGATDPFPAGYGHPYRAMGNYLSRL